MQLLQLQVQVHVDGGAGMGDTLAATGIEGACRFYASYRRKVRIVAARNAPLSVPDNVLPSFCAAAALTHRLPPSAPAQSHPSRWACPRLAG